MFRAVPIIHKNEKRISLQFENKADLNARVKKLEGVLWSQTLRSWHVPDNEKYRILFRLLDDGNTPISVKSEKVPETRVLLVRNVSVHVRKKSIYIHLPKDEVDKQFILSFRYTRWDRKNYCWVVPNYNNTLELIKSYFGERIKELKIEPISKPFAEQIVQAKDNEIILTRTLTGRINLLFQYRKELIQYLKTIPYHSWNPETGCWSIPYTEKFYKDIVRFSNTIDLKVTFFEENSNSEKTDRVSAKNAANYKQIPKEYELKLRELRYSESTIKTYKQAFDELINHFPEIHPTEIEENQIIDFLRYLVLQRKVSSSFQNQAINAIKFYYEKVLGQVRKVYQIDRPRQEKKLPTVLNIEEVTRLLKVTENIKHKSILMLAYSGGLRVSELVQVKISDIDSSRMQIKIVQSKGKKDRYTLLSVKLLELLRSYFKQYKPKNLLFEGQDGGVYSTRSIQQIMKDSVKKAGIKKNVSVHSLRHSFATHLLENGTDLRYIQALLGHESSKTTEIYTHITTKGFDQIINPLDQLDI